MERDYRNIPGEGGFSAPQLYQKIRRLQSWQYIKTVKENHGMLICIIVIQMELLSQRRKEDLRLR